LTAVATGGLRPDLTLLLDLDVARGLARRRDEGEEMNRLDLETMEFHRRVRDRLSGPGRGRAGPLGLIDADRPPPPQDTLRPCPRASFSKSLGQYILKY
jgi:dTMP kinase